ncbi:hypothetical protein AB0B10_25225 [Micromonospora arborensis]|uniref:hypothetical protein n=1 Tax=Micromonospora arborensis TaxID=2116518 RepID=UPI0033C31CC7
MAIPAGSHPHTRRGSQLGHKSTIALLLIAEAGGHEVALRDIPAADRHYVNSKSHVLAQMGLIVHGARDVSGDPVPPGYRIYSLTDLGRTAVELIRMASAW